MPQNTEIGRVGAYMDRRVLTYPFAIGAIAIGVLLASISQIWFEGTDEAMLFGVFAGLAFFGGIMIGLLARSKNEYLKRFGDNHSE